MESTTTETMITNEGEKVRISLLLHPSSSTTDSDTPSLTVPSNPIAIPSSTRRRGLSAIVNHLLDRRVPSSESGDDESESESESDDEGKLPAMSFDFLISDRLLRTTIESAARKLDLSLEDAIPVYYFPRRDSPSEDGTSETMPDWITALASIGGDSRSDGGRGSDVCAGGSDGWLRIYEGGGEGNILKEVGSIKGHSGVIKAMDSQKVPLYKGRGGGTLVASGGMDQTLVTHLIDAQSNGEDGGMMTMREMRLHAIYANGHRTSVNSVRMTGGWLASGDWDGGLCLWKVPSSSDDDKDDGPVPMRKKKKKKGTDTALDSTATAVHEVEAPTISLKAHSSNISGIAFGYSTTISPSTSSPLPSPPSSLLTSSWDHSIRSWDVETQNVVLTLNGSKVATCLTRCPNSNLVASGHTDYRVRLWDMRVKTGGGGGGEGDVGISDGMLRTSHSAWISAVQWTNDPYILTSASHDGTVKVWDIRSSLPLHTIRAHKKGEKALCLAVAEEGGSVFSGGTDCVVKRFRF